MYDTLEDDTLLRGRYRLLSCIGEGGMARVYRADDTEESRVVAVKILHRELMGRPDMVSRFEQEARLARSLRDPHIVETYDVGRDGDALYLVMEYVDGESLKALITREAPLSVEMILPIVRGLGAALDAAHAQGVIHRDIKPENVLITPERGVKVADFGIARALTSMGQTTSGMVFGSVAYLAPEQGLGRPVTAETDIYSAGIVLYEMLTGRLPFQGESPLATAVQQISTPPTPPRELVPEIPEPVEAVVLVALDKEPAARFPTGAALVSALEDAVGGRTTTVEAPAAPATITSTTAGTPAPLSVVPDFSDTKIAAPAASRRTAIDRAPSHRRRWVVAVGILATASVLAANTFASDPHASWKPLVAVNPMPPRGTPSGSRPADKLSGARAEGPRSSTTGITAVTGGRRRVAAGAAGTPTAGPVSPMHRVLAAFMRKGHAVKAPSGARAKRARHTASPHPLNHRGAATPTRPVVVPVSSSGRQPHPTVTARSGQRATRHAGSLGQPARSGMATPTATPGHGAEDTGRNPLAPGASGPGSSAGSTPGHGTAGGDSNATPTETIPAAAGGPPRTPGKSGPTSTPTSTPNSGGWGGGGWPTDTPTSTPAPTPAPEPTATSRPHRDRTPTPAPPSTTPPSTSTPTDVPPTATDTPAPTDTDTAVPTDLPAPTDTETPAPTPTETPILGLELPPPLP